MQIIVGEPIALFMHAMANTNKIHQTCYPLAGTLTPTQARPLPYPSVSQQSRAICVVGAPRTVLDTDMA